MAIQQKYLAKADRRTLNSYDRLYNAVSNKPLFNQEDWISAANDGSLDAYVQALFNSDNINIDDFRKKYNLNYANSKTRLIALYNEVDADRTNVDTVRKKMVQNADGTVTEEEYFASDYEYNLSLIRQQNDYYQQVRQNEIVQDIKDSMTAGDHIASFFTGIGTSAVSGIANGIDNLTALIGSIGETIVAQKGEHLDTFVETLASDKYRPFSELRQDLLDFETNYTSMRDINGNYTTYGKYVGGVMTSLGEMLPSMLIGAGVGKAVGSIGGVAASAAGKIGSVAAQTSFYAGMGAGNVQDLYQQFSVNGADISSASILANATIKSTLQWTVEKGLGKILGTTSLDNMVFGRAQSTLTSKTLTSAGIKSIFKDALQEGLEEVLQDTSDFLVDQGFGLFVKEYGDVSDISWQSLIDAFVIGGIASFAGSARNILTSERIVDGSGKKLNKIASWQYGIDMKSFAESVDIIEKRSYYFKTNEASFVKRELSDADRKAIKAATVEAYASYRMITSIYNEIGEERFKAANDVLEKITEKIQSGVFAVSDVTTYLSTFRSQLSGIAESQLQKIVEDFKEAGVTKVEKVVNTPRKKEKQSTNEENSKLEKLAEELNVDKVVVTDGDVSIKSEDTYFISKNKIAMSVGELLKSESIKNLVNSVVKDFGNGVEYKRVITAFKEYYGREASDNEIILALFYDKSFFSSTLLNGNKDVYKFLSYFVKLGKNIKNDTTLNRIQKVGINTIIKSWTESLTEYCIIHPQADTSLFLYAIEDPVKRKNTEDRIKRERWGGEIYNKIVSDVRGLSETDKTVLRNRVNRVYPQETAKLLYDDLLSNDLATRLRALSKLSAKYYDLFNFEYDGKTYMPDVCIPNRVFNRFLQNKNLTINTMLREDRLTDAERKLLQSGGDITESAILNLRKEQFKQINPNYTFTIDAGKISIFSESEYVGYSSLLRERRTIVGFDELDGLSPSDRKVPISPKKRTNYVSDLVEDSFSDMMKNSFTIDDIILDPDLLKESVKNDVIKFMKEKYNKHLAKADSESVYLYISNDLVTKHGLGLVLMSDGSYGIGDLTNIDYAINKNLKVENINENTAITDIFDAKYIPFGLKFKLVPGVDGVFRGFVTEDGVRKLDNTIYLGKELLKDPVYAKYVLAHEFHHAIQFHNGMNAGFGKWTNRLDTKTLKAIIADIRQHIPQLFDRIQPGSAEEIETVEQFVYMASGEATAYGLANTPIYDFYPVLINNSPYGQNVVLPWGTVIDISSKNVKIHKNTILQQIGQLSNTKSFKQLQQLLITNNFRALESRKNASNAWAHLEQIVTNSPAISFYISKHMRDITPDMIKNLISTFKGNERLRNATINKLYLDVRYIGSLDRFLEYDLPFVTIENNDLPARVCFVDSNAAGLANQVMSYINSKNLNLHTIKVRHGTVKPKDIHGYVNANGFKQIFTTNDTPVKELSDIDSNVSLDKPWQETSVSYNGKPFWCARVETNTGKIDRVWTYEEALEAGFDLNISENINVSYTYFTTELLQDNNRIEYDDFGNRLSDDLIDKINKQITVTTEPDPGAISYWNKKYHDFLREADIVDDASSLYDYGKNKAQFVISFIVSEYRDNLVDKYKNDPKVRRSAVTQFKETFGENATIDDVEIAALIDEIVEDKVENESKKLEELGSELYDYVSNYFAVDDTTIDEILSEVFVNDLDFSSDYVDSNVDSDADADSSEIRPPNKNELREDDPRAKNFRRGEQSSHGTYLARYYVIDDKGNQVLRRDGFPRYKYVYPKEKTHTRKVGQRKWRGTKLEPFTKKYHVTELSKDFQDFVLNAEGLDPVLQDKIDGKFEGTLTRDEVMSYFRSKDKIDDKTFKAINDAFFKNEYIDSLKELEDIATTGPDAWALWRVAKRVPALREYLDDLHDREMSLELFRDIALSNEKAVSLYKNFSYEFTNLVTKRSARDLEVPEHYFRIALMKHYDGSIKSIRDAASAARTSSLSKTWKVTPKDSSWNEIVTDAYEDATELLDDLSYDEILQLLVARKAAELRDEYNNDLAKVREESLKYASEIGDLSRSGLIKLYNGRSELNKAIIEGVMADATGQYLSVKTDAVPTSRTYVDRMKGAVATIRSKLTGKEQADLVKKYPDVFNKDLTVKKELYKVGPNRNDHYKIVDEVIKVFEKVNDIKNDVLLHSRSTAEELKLERKLHKISKREINRLKKGVKSDGKTPHVVEIVTDDDVEQLAVEKEMPLPLLKMLQVHYNHSAKTKVQNLSSDNDRHKKRVANDFYSNADEILLNLTQADADDIIDFFTNGIINLNDATAPYQVAEMLIMSYFIEVGRTGSVKLRGKNSFNNPSPVNFVINESQLAKLEDLLEKRISRPATVLATWRHVLHQLDPIVTIQQSVARKSGVKATKEEIESILNAIQTGEIDKIKKAKEKVYNSIKNRVDEKRRGKKSLDDWLDRILQWERLAMLSGPGTWVRNATSNCLVQGTHWTADKVMPGLDSLLYKLFPKNQTIEGQYKIAKTQITKEVSDYIKDKLISNGLFDLSIEGISKYDTRKSLHGLENAVVLSEMLSRATVGVANAHNLFTNKPMAKVEAFIKKAISDDPWVKKAALAYLGKMITEDLELSRLTEIENAKIKEYNDKIRKENRGRPKKEWADKLKPLKEVRISSKAEFLSENHISKEFLVYVAEAYKMAAYDYMHRSNVLLRFESKLMAKSYKAYFMYKQVFPFAGVGWNWFVEGLNYTPVGLVNSILNFAKLENTIEKMDENRRTYKNGEIGPSSRFAEYITKRNITKGVIGSIGTIAGALLVAFGYARLDEEDEIYTLRVGDVSVDVSDLFGTQGIFLGMAITSALRNESTVGDMCVATLDQLFMDSTFSDVFNTFRYNDSFGEFLVYQTYALPNMLIPNFFKTFSDIIYPYKVDFSDGFKGKLQRLGTGLFLSHFMPCYYDPYTGEKQIANGAWYYQVGVDAINRLTPLGISVYNVSELERNAIKHGIHKKQLTGRYEINDAKVNLSAKDTEKLNMYYGKLNVASFKEVQSNRTQYKIQQPNGKYKNVRWSQMTDKEKAAVVDRIMTNNSSYAKIYILTDSNNYKYYASDSEYKTLRSLGITKNVYKANNKYKGFVKIN